MLTAHQLRQDRYREWLEAVAGDRFNFPSELAALANHKVGVVVNDTPRVELWHNILPTLALVTHVREAFGPVTLRSGYRSPDYNRATPNSAPDSQHCQNTALDFSAEDGTPAEWHAFLRELRNVGAFVGGLGLYRTFVHIDTRGTNADWVGA